MRPWVKTAIFLTAAGATALATRRRPLPGFRGASVLITGGSRGLGLEIARRFAAEGARLSLVARDAQELERARRELSGYGADVMVQTCDVRQREEATHAVASVVAARGCLDVLVNNAGVVQVGPWGNMTREDFDNAMAVHAWGPLHMMQAAIPAMQAQGGGRIVNISSIGGLVAVPHLLPYSMSKFALVGLSDGLRAELARDKIRVTTVAPGLMRTGSHVNAQFKGQHEKEYVWFAFSAASPLFATRADQAARRIVEACRRGQARLIITPQAKLLHIVNALFPGVTAAGQKLAARLLPKPAGGAGYQLWTGQQSRPRRMPEFLTRLGDQAALRNNETLQ